MVIMWITQEDQVNTTSEPTVTETDIMLASMLTENTGSHLLDSGIYGRAWQTARAKYGLDAGLPNSRLDGGPSHASTDPAHDELVRVAELMTADSEGSIDDWGVCSVSAFHWLRMRVDYDPVLDRKYRRYIDKLWAAGNFPDRYDARIEWRSELGAMDRFCEQLKVHGAELGGVYGEGEPITDNTYNHDDVLDRTLQYTLFTIENPIEWAGETRRIKGSTIGEPTARQTEFIPDGEYVLLQVHGGADVRGGYTDSHLFRVSAEDFFDYDRIEVWCEGVEEDVVPDNMADGQTTIEGEVLHPVHVEHRHRWDNSYDGGHLRLTYSIDGPEGTDGWHDCGRDDAVLGFRRDDEPDTDNVDDYARRSGITTVNNAHRNEDGVWVCPFDGSPLVCGPQMVG